MSTAPRSTALYPHPFSRAYWRDAVSELKSTKMLVFAALMIAVRVAMKLVAIPLAPNLKINTAFIANAIGAMVYGPVVAAVSAVISDVLGVMLTGDVYFVPFVLTEIAGSVIFALFLYRARLTPTRVMLSRFSICLFVNILLQTPLMMLYYKVMMGGASYVLTVPQILKNLFMFPIETVILSLILSAIQPITYRMGLTYGEEHALRFDKKQVATLAVLFVIGCGCVAGYLNYHYQRTSITTGYTTQEQADTGKAMYQIICQHQEDADDAPAVAIIDSAYRPFLSHEVTYNVSVYHVDLETAATDEMEKLWALKKTPASKHKALTKAATATIVQNEKTSEVLSYSYTPVE